MTKIEFRVIFNSDLQYNDVDKQISGLRGMLYRALSDWYAGSMQDVEIECCAPVRETIG